jgi:hypothetical protein
MNEGTNNRYTELIKQWKSHQAEAKRLIETAIPSFNKPSTKREVNIFLIRYRIVFIVKMKKWIF